MAHCQHVASWSIFYYFCRCSFELAQLVPFPFSWGRSTCYSGKSMIFLSPFLDATRMSMSKSFFPHTARLWNSLPIECFPLTYDLNCRFFLNRFPVCCNIFMILFLLTVCLIVDIFSLAWNESQLDYIMLRFVWSSREY